MTHTATRKAADQVAALIKEGVGNIRAGRPDRLFQPPLPGSVSQRFNAAYETWMQLRAASGNKFALSLGYTGRPDNAQN